MAAASQQKTKFIVAYWNDMKFIIYPPLNIIIIIIIIKKKKKISSLCGGPMI